MNWVKKGIVAAIAAALGASSFAYPAVAADDAAKVHITGQAHVGDAGTMVTSFDIEVSDPAHYRDLTAGDFDITGNYDGYPLNVKGEVVQNNYADDELNVSMQGQLIHLNFRPFLYKGGSIEKFAVKNSRFPELSFTADDVSQLSIQTVDDFKPGVITSSDGESLPYRLKLSSSAGPRPLVVWLHGGGEVGTDNIKQLTENRGSTTWTESGKDTSVLAVHYPQNYDWAIYDKPDQLAKMQQYFTMQQQFIQQLIADGKVDPNRIYVAGVSSGGGGAFRFLMQYPDLFAGAIVIAAKDTIADYKGSVDAFKTALKSLVHTPIWIVHAENDPITDSRTSKLAYQALTELGSTQVKETLYSDAFMDSQRFYGAMKHWSWVPAFHDQSMMDWLFAQHKTGDTTAADSSNTPAGNSSNTPITSTPITRAELAALLRAAMNDTTLVSTAATRYTDIANVPQKDAIQAVTAAGWMRGVGKKQFAPNAAVTRAQLAVIVAAWLKQVDPSQQVATTGYTDVPPQHWAYTATLAVKPLSILPGTSEKLEPVKTVSTAEATQLITALTTYANNMNKQ
ncbi:S-layer homology domain-containing protein [Paenibacillus kandeliae]|uniref:S-layer homology domain-containing protein n=1 Tax=Paenibacillus kandeliae TaxID=3231269 RepID=UPI0034596B98